MRALGLRLLITGMGQKNAERSIRAALAERRPGVVFTCGFAGGLNPDLKLGDVVYAGDAEVNLDLAMEKLGGRRALFRSSTQVLAKAEDKQVLRELSGNDAVEMESAHIRAICRREGIPSATIRVILDEVGTDLPVDFNAFLTPEQNLNYAKLIWAIVRRPSLIRGLRQLQRDSGIARQRLDEALNGLFAIKG